jgi:competence protein ComEC
MQRLAGFAALPLLWISLSFTVGVGAGAVWLPALRLCWTLVGMGLLFATFTTLFPRLPVWLADRRRLAGLAAVCLAAFSLGLLRYRASLPDFTPADLAWYNDQGRVSLVGVVAQDPDVRDTYAQVRLQVEQITLEAGGAPIEVTGLLLVYLPKSDWRYGDRLYVSGELLTPPAHEDFSFRAYLARWDIHSYMPYAFADRLDSGQGTWLKTWIYAFKQRALDSIYRYLPDPEASLAAGILLGVESGIPEDVELAFQETGTTHIIAISGFNITIVSGLFAVLFGRVLGPRRGAVAALVGISIYTLMVGADPPVVRAAVMGGLSLFARQVGRRQHGLNSLAFTAAVMLAFNPLLLWDAGFQLSFAATLGLIVYAAPWTEAIENLLARRLPPQAARRLAGPASEYFLLTLAAQLTTFPILVCHFQRVSWVSLPANLLILPAQPPVMILGGIAVLLGLVWAPLGQLGAYLVWPFVAYTIRMVEWIAGFSQASAVGQVSPLFVFGYYLVLFLATVFFSPEWKQRLPKLKPALVLAGLLVLTVLVWQAALAAPDGELHAYILDVGDGAAVLIQTPQGRCLLIGGGSSTIRLSDSLGRMLPLFHRQLDLLVVPSTDKQYAAALPEVVSRFPPRSVYWAGLPGASRPAEELYAYLHLEHIPVEGIAQGARIDLGDSARLEVLFSSEQETIVLLAWKNFRLLIPYYWEEPAEAAIRLSGLEPVSVLVISGDTLGVPLVEWFSAVRPELVVISRQTRDAALPPEQESGFPVLSTDQVGWVHLLTDGESLWLTVEHD